MSWNFIFRFIIICYIDTINIKGINWLEIEHWLIKGFIQILFLQKSELNCRPFVWICYLLYRYWKHSALRISIEGIHSKGIKQVKNLRNYIIDILEIRLFLYPYMFFNRNAIDNFHANTKFSHWPNANRRLISISQNFWYKSKSF